MYYVYICECSDKTLYTGITTDIIRREREHNGELAGGAKYTKIRRPVICIYTELYPTRILASQREYQIKKLSREKKIYLIKQKKTRS